MLLGIVGLISVVVRAWVLYDYLRINVIDSLPRIAHASWERYIHAPLAAFDCILLWFITSAPPSAREHSEDSTGSWIRLLATWNAVAVAFLDFRGRYLQTDVTRFWGSAINLLAAVEIWLIWAYFSRWARRIPDERLERNLKSVRFWQTGGMLLGPTLATMMHLQAYFSVGARIFVPMPGKLVLLLYTFIASIVLFRLARSMSQLAEEPLP
jgi:hypothetical protein